MPPPPTSGDLNSLKVIAHVNDAGLRVPLWNMCMFVTFEVTAHIGDAGHHTHPYTTFEVHRPSRSEDMTDFRSRR